MCWQHRRSQNFLLGGAPFSVEKVDDLFLVAASKTQAKTTKLTAPTLQTFPAHHKCALKFDFLFCLGVHWVINYAPKKLFSTQCTSRLRLWLANCYTPVMLIDVCELFQNRSRRSVLVVARPPLTGRHHHHRLMTLLFNPTGTHLSLLSAASQPSDKN